MTNSTNSVREELEAKIKDAFSTFPTIGGITGEMLANSLIEEINIHFNKTISTFLQDIEEVKEELDRISGNGAVKLQKDESTEHALGRSAERQRLKSEISSLLSSLTNKYK